MNLKLTPKQQKILLLIRDCQLTRGYSPTLQELADELIVAVDVLRFLLCVRIFDQARSSPRSSSEVTVS